VIKTAKEKFKQYEVLLTIVTLAAIGGGIGAISKIGLRTLSPISFTFLRFVFAAIILIPVVLLRERKIKFTKVGTLLFISLLATINVTLFIFGVGHTTATISQTLYAAVPLLSAVITFLIYKERLSKRKEYGLLVGFLGVILIIFLPILGKPTASSGTLLGNLLIFAAVVSFSFYSVLSKGLQKNYSPLIVTSTLVILTVIIQAALLPLDPNNLVSISKMDTAGFLAVLYTGVLGTGFYYLVYQQVIKKASSVVASLTLYLQPVFGVFWAAALLGERLTLGFIAGAVLALVGVYIVTNSK